MKGLTKHMPFYLASFIVYTIAIIPGFIYTFVALSLLVDRRPQARYLGGSPGLTILIPDYNESSKIVGTVRSIRQNEYEGLFEIIVITTVHLMKLPRYSRNCRV